MEAIPVSRAARELHRLVVRVANQAEPVLITGPRSQAVLISGEQWRGIQESLYLLSVPGLREDIKEGMAMPIDETLHEADW